MCLTLRPSHFLFVKSPMPLEFQSERFHSDLNFSAVPQTCKTEVQQILSGIYYLNTNNKTWTQGQARKKYYHFKNYFLLDLNLRWTLGFVVRRREGKLSYGTAFWPDSLHILFHVLLTPDLRGQFLLQR